MEYNKKDALFYHLGFFWCLPISMIFWLIYGILYFCKQIDGVYWSRDLVITWDVKNSSWLGRKLFLGRGWGGFSAGCNALVLDCNDDPRWVRTVKHEKVHCFQQYKYGVLFPVLYIWETVRVYFFERDKHSYYDNCYEIQARVLAGQPEIIPKEQWKGRPGSRWIWW